VDSDINVVFCNADKHCYFKRKCKILVLDDYSNEIKNGSMF
jgi:hypothetical protein